MSVPKRYQFDNQLPATRQAPPLPVYQPVPLPEQQAQQVVVNHYHEAPQPDRTVQRLALGAGMGAGAVAAGVYFLPLLIAALQSLVMGLISLAFALAVAAWAVHTIVNAIGGKAGQAAAKTTRRGLRRRR